MKHKVSELEGALLDAAVAKADGLVPVDYEYGSCWYSPEPFRGLIPYEPSINWSLAGPIIERERIMLEPDRIPRWISSCGDAERVGPTPLIAAMRAYVASKFGAEVDLP